MFRDADEELKRLEEELLLEETEDETEEEYEEESADQVYYDPDRVYNADDVDVDPEELGEEILRPRKKGGLGAAICLLLLAAALLIAAAIVLRLRG